MQTTEPIRPGRSSQTGGSRSRVSSPARITRLLSGNHLGDRGQYHHHPEEQSTINDRESNSGEDEEERDDEKNLDTTDSAETRDKREVIEVRMGVADILNVESGPRMEGLEKKRSTRERGVNLVDWEGPDDSANPKNWSTGRKWAVTLVVSSFMFISPVSSSMVAPALTAVGSEFGITSDIELSLTLSIFVLAYAVGPLFLGPLSEMYERVIVLRTSNLLYIFFNLGYGLAQTESQLIIFRFLSGLGGSAPLALGGGVLSDLFTADERGKAISIYSLAPLLGPAIGPIAGGFVTENTTWPRGNDDDEDHSVNIFALRQQR